MIKYIVAYTSPSEFLHLQIIEAIDEDDALLKKLIEEKLTSLEESQERDFNVNKIYVRYEFECVIVSLDELLLKKD